MWDNNIYYNSENLGLSTFESVEFSDQNYQYDTLLILQRDADGALFYAEDSGCSCPTPFEGWTLADLYENPINETTVESFVAYMNGRGFDGYDDNRADVAEKVRKHVHGNTTPSYTTEDERWGA